MTLLRLAHYVSSLPGRGPQYVALGFTRFLRAYGRGYYDEAGVWGRRIAEAFCLFELGKEYEEVLLGELVWALPDSVWPLRAYDLTSGNAEVSVVAANLGLGLSSASIFDDLSLLKRYGNEAAHAHAVVFGRPVGPDPRVFVAVLRVVLCFAYRQSHSKL